MEATLCLPTRASRHHVSGPVPGEMRALLSPRLSLASNTQSVLWGTASGAAGDGSGTAIQAFRAPNSLLILLIIGLSPLAPLPCCLSAAPPCSLNLETEGH